jgi:hypothetical protein
MKLLSPASANTKTRKSAEKAKEYRIVSLMLSPADSGGGRTNCANASPGCMAGCVGNDLTGLALVFKRIGESRREKTRWMHADRAGFMKQLIAELEEEQRISEREGVTLVARLNCFSDLNFYSVIRRFPKMIAYDYSKVYNRLLDPEKPGNYFITASWSERPADQKRCAELLRAGENVAVPFYEDGPFTGNRALNQKLPKTWTIDGLTVKVEDGDDSDLRFLDRHAKPGQPGYCIGLRLKAGTSAGRLASIQSGFAQRVE